MNYGEIDIHDSCFMIHDSKKIHMVGIKGQGMAALAELLRAEGKHISGSDTKESFSTDAVLRKLGIRVRTFQKKNITKRLDAVIRSSAYGDSHVEIAAARRLGIPVFNYIDAVAELCNKKRGILVTGTHGKTTVTALIGCLLEDTGFDPTVLVGATVRRWGRNARVGKGTWMVAEGDEYQNKFLQMRPEVLIVTSIEYDHPDFFRTKSDYVRAFRTMVSQLDRNGLLIAERSLKRIIKKAPCRVVWYGIAGKKEGRHLELNREAARQVARYLGISSAVATHSFDSYEGTARRMEFYTSPEADTVVIDDYAHHPTALRTTLAAVRKQFPARHVTVFFQPHTYSRTSALLDDFAESFEHVDEVILLPIYSSQRENAKDFPHDLLRRLQHRMRRVNAKQSIRVMTIQEAIRYGRNLSSLTRKRVLITLGAGNGWKIAKGITYGKSIVNKVPSSYT